MFRWYSSVSILAQALETISACSSGRISVPYPSTIMPSYSFITLLALSTVSGCQAFACGEIDPATGWIPGPALKMRFNTSVKVNVGTSDKPISVRLDGDYYFVHDVKESAFRDYGEDSDWGLDLQTYRQFRKHMVDI